MRKKAHIWELFFAAQFLWPQHFYIALHMIYMGYFIYLNNKITNKNNNKDLLDKKYRQLAWKIAIFSTHSKSKKKLPYGRVFLLLLYVEKIPIFIGNIIYP